MPPIHITEVSYFEISGVGAMCMKEMNNYHDDCQENRSKAQDTQRVEEPAQGKRTSSSNHSSLLWAQHQFSFP